jgi:hypothetical protein
LRPAPWGPLQQRVRACAAPGDTLPIATLSGVSLVATGLSPILLGQPLVLVALTPRLPFLVVAARQVSLPVFLVVAGLRLCVADVFWFRIGQRLGLGALDRLPRRCRRVLDGAPRTRGVVVAALLLVRPIGRHLVAAGAVGLRPATVVALDLVGTIGFLVVLWLGAGAFH